MNTTRDPFCGGDAFKLNRERGQYVWSMDVSGECIVVVVVVVYLDDESDYKIFYFDIRIGNVSVYEP